MGGRHWQEDQWPRLHQKDISSAHEKLGEIVVAQDRLVEGQLKLLSELQKEVNENIKQVKFYDAQAEAEVERNNPNYVMNSHAIDMLEGYSALVKRFTDDLDAYQFRLMALKFEIKKHADLHEPQAMQALAEFKENNVEGLYYTEDFDFEPLRKLFRDPE